MRYRCRNPEGDNWKYYGGKGISIDPKWETFEGFEADMGERPPGTSLDRRDSDKDYCKDNCKWSTEIEQQNNRSNNRNVTFDGKTQSLSMWARETGLPFITLYKRMFHSGWSVEDTLTTPARPYNRKAA